MLTGHQRVALRVRLPEVSEMLVVEHPDRFPIVRLKLLDGSEISIYGRELNRVSRSRLRQDDSALVELLPIPGEMRARLEAVFGSPMSYRGGPC